MKKSFLTLFACVLVLVFTSIAWAQEEDEEIDDAYQQIADLMDISVEAVSKGEEETLAKSPGIISILTAEDIDNLGAHTVAEALSFMPGFFGYDSYYTQFNQFAIRGNFAAEHYNSKILFTVNGHPIYMGINGGFEVNAIPLDAIKRIEVIRGPVSVMYGTNALSGVINIVTWKEIPYEMGKLTYLYDSNKTNEFRVSLGKKYDDFRYFASGTFRDQEGDNLHIRPDQDEAGRGSDNPFFEDYRNLFINMEYKDLQIDLGYWHNNKPAKYGIVPNSLFHNPEWEHSYYYADLRYNRELSENVTMSVNLRADTAEFEWVPNGLWFIDPDASNPGYSKAVNDKFGGETFFNLKGFDGAMKLLVGVSYDKYNSGPFTFASDTNPKGSWLSSLPDKVDTDDTAAFTSLTYDLNETVRLVGGLRYTDNSLTGGHTDYRAGLIISAADNLVFKGLYGTSYRSPNHFELFTKTPPILNGSEDLDVETLSGFDLSMTYSYENKFIGTVGFFINETEDFITRRVLGGIPTYTNIEGTKLYGIEYEGSYQPTPWAKAFFNGTHIIDTEDLGTGAELDYVVEHMMNFGLALNLMEELTISSSNSYHSEWLNTDSLFLSNLIARYEVPDIDQKITLFVTINNLFDEEYEYPEFVRRRIDTIPGGPARTFAMGITFGY